MIKIIKLIGVEILSLKYFLDIITLFFIKYFKTEKKRCSIIFIIHKKFYLLALKLFDIIDNHFLLYI